MTPAPLPAHPDDPAQARRRAQILAAAGQLFAARGFAATHVEDIARQAGLSVGSIYRLFPNKDSLYAELLGGAFDRLLGHLQHRLGRAETVDQLAAGLVRTFLDWAAGGADGVDVLLFVLGPSARLSGQLRARLAGWRETGQRILAARLDRIGAGPCRPELLEVLWEMLMGLALSGRWRPDPDDLATFGARAVAAVLGDPDP